VTVDEEVLLMVAASMFALATAWAAWVSKTLITILSVMRRTEEQIETIEGTVADHETRIRGLEAG